MSACSRTMARSTTWSMVVGGAVGAVAGAGRGCRLRCVLQRSGARRCSRLLCHRAEPDQQGSGDHPFPSTHNENPLCSCLVRQLEHDMYDRGRVYRLIKMLGRFESHLVGSRDRGFVQAVTQTAHHAIHV